MHFNLILVVATICFKYGCFPRAVESSSEEEESEEEDEVTREEDHLVDECCEEGTCEKGTEF